MVKVLNPGTSENKMPKTQQGSWYLENQERFYVCSDPKIACTKNVRTAHIPNKGNTRAIIKFPHQYWSTCMKTTRFVTLSLACQCLRSHSDINVLHRSPLFARLCAGEDPTCGEWRRVKERCPSLLGTKRFFRKLWEAWVWETWELLIRLF